MPLFTTLPATAPRRLQRACACAAKAPGGCDTCNKKKRVQRQASGATSASTTAANHETGGQTLHPRWRGPLERQYGTGFADVRVHDDAASHAAARQLNAHAFTVGQHVHFAASRYAPHTRDGLHLLAHELTHTVQQRGATSAPARDTVEVDAADTPFEREADRQADAVVAGRSAAVRAGSAGNGVQARLQRAPAKLEGSADRAVDANTTVSITRTLIEPPCDKPELVNKRQSTPSSQVFYANPDGQTVGLRYQICDGKVQLDTGGEVSYSDVVKAGEDLLKRVGKNPADAQAAFEDAVNGARVTATGHVSFTVSKTLDVTLSSDSSAGATQQTAQVKLRVVVNSANNTVRVLAEAGAGITNQPDVSRQIETFVRTQLNVGPAAIELKYSNTATTPAGGAGSSQGTASAKGQVKLGNTGITLEGGVEKPDGQDARLVGGFKGTFGKPDAPKEVKCYECKCPPPRPDYSCRRVVKEHTEDVPDQPYDKQMHRLLYQYDSAAPDPKQGFSKSREDAPSFQSKVSAIAALSRTGYAIKHIHGFASPEASRSYNEALGLKRARQAEQAIAKQRSDDASAVPAAESQGERLGSGATLEGQETPNDGLTAELGAKLKAAATDDARLELLSVDTALRNDPVERARIIDDIHAFMNGSDPGGNRVKRRAKWEKVFPHLRRVEVELERLASTRPKLVGDSNEASACSPEDRAFIDSKLGPIPLEKRLPADQCRPPR